MEIWVGIWFAAKTGVDFGFGGAVEEFADEESA